MRSYLDTQPGEVLLVGHSRGGKISVLSAWKDREKAMEEGRSSRVSSLILLDPVDGSYDSIEGPRCAGNQVWMVSSVGDLSQ